MYIYIYISNYIIYIYTIRRTRDPFGPLRPATRLTIVRRVDRFFPASDASSREHPTLLRDVVS